MFFAHGGPDGLQRSSFSHSRFPDFVVAVNGRIDSLWYPAGGVGATWMPEMFGESVPLNVKVQHTCVGPIVTFTFPEPGEVVWR